MWRLIFAFLLIASSAFAQEQQASAYQALRVVGTQFNRAAIKRVISVTGVQGDPQPMRWNILIADRNAPGGVREFQVANGRIIANQNAGGVVGSTKGATIDTSKLNLDSTGAFSVASYTADKSHVNFASVSYTLRTNERGFPVWIVTLQDESRRPLGKIHINANRGNVTRVEGLYRGTNMAQVEQDPAPRTSRQHRRGAGDDEYSDPAGGDDVDAGDDDGDVNPVKAEIKRMFRRTKRDAEHIFERARRPFDEFFNHG